jgi:hypothetical protein
VFLFVFLFFEIFKGLTSHKNQFLERYNKELSPDDPDRLSEVLLAGMYLHTPPPGMQTATASPTLLQNFVFRNWFLLTETHSFFCTF